jgi:ketosteroid isomerase-like protein
MTLKPVNKMLMNKKQENYPTFYLQSFKMKKIISLFLLTIIISGKLMAQTTTKSATENKPTIAILDDFAAAFNAHDAVRIVSYMTDDCIFEASAGPDMDGEKFVGKEAVTKAFEDIFKNYPNAKWNDAHHFISGNRAVSEWTFTGTKPDGSKMEVTGCDLFTFRDGKIYIKNSYRKNRPPIPKPN